MNTTSASLVSPLQTAAFPVPGGLRRFLGFGLLSLGLGTSSLQATLPYPAPGDGTLVHYTNSQWNLVKSGNFNASTSAVDWTITATKSSTSRTLIAAGYIDIRSPDVTLNYPTVITSSLVLAGTPYSPSSLQLRDASGNPIAGNQITVPAAPPPPPGGFYDDVIVRVHYVAVYNEPPGSPGLFNQPGASSSIIVHAGMTDPVYNSPYNYQLTVNGTLPSATAVNASPTLTDTPLSISQVLSGTQTLNPAQPVVRQCDPSQVCNIASLSAPGATLLSASQFIVPIVVPGFNLSSGQICVSIPADDRPPRLTSVPSDISVPCGTTVSFSASAEGCEPVSISFSHPPGSTFPLGSTTVTVTATDRFNRSSSASFSVTVTDSEKPVITVPANIVTSIDPGKCTAKVNFSATATDCTAVTLSYSHASGSDFPIGTTTVTVTATDAAGNVQTANFTVTVNDNEAPVIAPLANLVRSTDAGLCSAVVTFMVNATDCSAVNVVASPASGSAFPKGVTTVNVTATDAAGNQSTSSFTVTVNDTEAPVITSPLGNIVLQNDAGKCYATFSYIPAATDNCPGVTVVATGVPTNGQLAAGTTTTITVTATDAAGNTTVRMFTVTVGPCLGSLGNLVWHDLNRNGLQDAGEPGVDGVKVNLFTAGGTAAGTTTTASGGLYRFDNLVPGDYYVIFDTSTLPAGYIFTSQNAGLDDTRDSDANPSTGKSEGNATVVGAQFNDTVDAGIVRRPLALVCAGTTGKVGTPYSSSLVASGGIQPYTFSIATGSLPPGLTLNAATGAITGTPTAAGTYNYTAQVNDLTGNGQQTVTANCSITVSPADCVPTTFAFNGSTPVSGTAGNIRTYTVNGISVKVSAFSRTKPGSTGTWAPAYLGVYGGGLGVTDSSETGSGNTHTVNNVGRDNFVLFEFSQPVVLNRAYLGYVVTDSDLSVWVGNANDPFNNHLTLSNAVLNSLTREDNLTTSSSARWASLNAGQISGNVLVIAAHLDDTTPDDHFKIGALDICQPPPGPVALACAAATTGTVGTPFSSSLVATGGTAPYTFSITGGSLPTGLSLNAATGAITGTPTVAGAFTFTAKVVTSTGTTGIHTASRSCTITIAAPPCVQTTISFSGSSAVSGTAGNIRTYTINGISVKVSAFSRTKPTAGSTWAPAYLGVYGGGLGVTDSSESGSGNSHTVNNVGRDNFVLFEFSQPVVINRAFLGYVVNDSDLSVWIGNANDPYNNHLTLSNSLLGTLAREDNLTSSTTTRWANLNAAQRSGNVLVIAANIDDTSPEDHFKIGALDLCRPAAAACVAGTFTFSGSTSTSGTAGNIRTYSINGVSVKVSAFSRTKPSAGSNWAPAYLGAYSGGLGVTDSSESGSGSSHTVNNVGRDNFVLFEFSQPVVINRAYLGYVVTDSDMSVWIGNKNDPFNNHLTLSTAVLDSLTREDNLTTSSSARWANLNAGELVGNVLVIAAHLDDTTPDDHFKINKLDICLP